MQLWNVLHAARWKYKTQKSRQKSQSRHHRTTLSGYIFATYRQSEKKLVKHQFVLHMSSYNMVNFGLLTAEICWRVSSTPANFNGFRVLAALQRWCRCQWLTLTMISHVGFGVRSPRYGRLLSFHVGGWRSSSNIALTSGRSLPAAVIADKLLIVSAEVSMTTTLTRSLRYVAEKLLQEHVTADSPCPASTRAVTATAAAAAMAAAYAWGLRCQCCSVWYSLWHSVT